MAGKVYRNISCLVTNDGVVKKEGRRPREEDLGIIHDAALAYDRGILWVGKDKNLPRQFRAKSWRHASAKGLTAYPGLVDPHTHPVFAGDRSREFELRMRGATYQEIAEAGGGIATSVKQTRLATSAQLSGLLKTRLENFWNFGVRLLEAKSGYGLDLKTELRSLEVLRSARTKIEIVPTCLAAHAVPAERKNDRNSYVEEIIQKILPLVAKKRLAEYVDVFCDQGYFSVDESLKIIAQAKRLGLSVRVHGEELSNTEIASAAADAGAHSVDHLLKVSDQGVARMAQAGTVGVLLPSTSFYLREPPAPARKLIDAGVRVALATDFNPGSSPTQNLPFVGTLAAVQLGMTTAEIVAALTFNGALSLRRENSFGANLPGFKALPCFAEGDHPSALFYRFAVPALPQP